MMDLTNEDVADILALLDSLPYDELDLRTPRFRLTLRRAPDGGWTEESRVLSEPVPVPQSPNGSPPDNGSPPGNGVPDISEISGAGGEDGARGEDGAGDEGGAGDAEGGEAADADLVAVTAPLPGTFYRAPRPGAPPFVEVGDLVREDTVVAIVETMKLMNSVPAGTCGRVARICVDNAEFTARGATLMFIEPDISGAGTVQSRLGDAGAPLGVSFGANSALNDTPNEDEPLTAKDMSDISDESPGSNESPDGPEPS